MLGSFLGKINLPVESMKRDWNLLPNLISYARLALCWTLIPLLVAGSHDVFWRWIALLTFIIVVSTDFIDGWIARRFNMTSDWGRFIDPIADKVLIVLTAILIAIVDISRVGISMFYVFLAVSIAREVILPFQIWRKQRQVVSPTLLGKIKMFMQSILLVFWLVPPNFFIDLIVAGLTLVTVAIVCASWVEYYYKFVR